MKNVCGIMILFSFFVADAVLANDSDLKCPPEAVKMLIERGFACGHWEQEEAFDADREEQIKSAITRLRCNKVEKDKKYLARKYRNNKDIQSMLADYTKFVASYPKAKEKWVNNTVVYCNP